MIKMKTNEENRIKADRRIPLTPIDKIYEILGNMNGSIMKIDTDDKFKCLHTYVNDNGFSKKDKEAILMKNLSGDSNSKTAGLNGHGIKLTIDRILPKDESSFACVYSINDKMKCTIGHFTYTPWIPFDEDDKKNFQEYKTGSYFIIPLNDNIYEDFIKTNDKKVNIKYACVKYLNKFIANNDLDFFYNGKQLKTKLLCPNNDHTIIIKYSIGYDCQKQNLDPNHKKPLIFKIIECNKNINEINLQKCFKVNKSPYIEHSFEYEYHEIETGNLYINIVLSKDIIKYDDNDNDNDIEYINLEDLENYNKQGCNIYINNRNCNWKCMSAELGGKTQNGEFGEQIYGGFPRFENHIHKSSLQYKIPADKANIQPTTIGRHVLKFMRYVGMNYFPEAEKRRKELEEEAKRNKLANTKKLVEDTQEPTSVIISAPSPTVAPLPTLASVLKPIMQEQVVSPTTERRTASPNIVPTIVPPTTEKPVVSPTTQCDNRPAIPIKSKEKIWSAAFGEKRFGSCYCCKATLKLDFETSEVRKIEYGHIIPYNICKHNNIDNILPICRTCNRSMNCVNMRDFICKVYPYNIIDFDSKVEKYRRILHWNTLHNNDSE